VGKSPSYLNPNLLYSSKSKSPSYLVEDTPRKKSQKQEKKLATKGFVTPASGAIWAFKGDVSFSDYLVEAKRTDKQSMIVKGEWLDKIYKESVMVGKEAGIELEIGKYIIQGRVCIK
jgi:hypothetical protein